MKIVRRICLTDGSEHSSKEIASRHLYNALSSRSNLEVFEGLSNLPTLKIRSYFIDHLDEVEKVLHTIKELKALDNLEFN